MTEQTIERHVARHAAEWFPDIGPAPTVQLRHLSTRQRSVLYAVHLGDGPGVPRIVAKVRRGEPTHAQRPGGRPRLSAAPLPLSEQTATEYDGLHSIFRAVDESSSSFGAVRPLSLLAAENAILMEFVPAGTLRQHLVRECRLLLPRRDGSAFEGESPWRQAGAWLRMFQRAMPRDGRPTRQSTRQDVVDLFNAYHDFLGARLGARSVGDLAKSGAELAEAVLPDQLSMTVGHGDYAPRNVFIDEAGRLTVFDPLPRFAVPCHDDLCRFLVGIRLLGVQLHSRGAAFAQHDLERREHEVISGYHGLDQVPVDQLRCYQLLIMLDKWSALVDGAPQSWPGRIRLSSIESASGYLRGQGRRLIELAHATSACT